jgi:hypothetical protein
MVEGRLCLDRQRRGGVVERLGIGLQAAVVEPGADLREGLPHGVAAIAGQAGAATMARQVAVGGGVTDIAGVDDQAPFVPQETRVDGGAFGCLLQRGVDVGSGGDAHRAEEALVLGEGGGRRSATLTLRGAARRASLARRPSARRPL